MTENRILVIKLGALGDFVQALGACAAIQRHHAEAHVTLLTAAPYKALAEHSGYFDEIMLDTRPSFGNIAGWLRLRHNFRSGGFSRIYDLQTSDRSSLYFQLMWPGPKPEWSGIAPGCSHPHTNAWRDSMHTIERQAEQLGIAGIGEVPPPDLSWADADVSRFGLSPRYFLLVPGGAVHRPEKRWPSEHYAALARGLLARDIEPVLIGGPAEADLLAEIAAAAPGSRNLADATAHVEIVALARAATGAVGNDTGPMHLIALSGCQTVVLFSNASDPALCAQRGLAVKILQRPALGALSVDKVEAVIDALS